MKLGRQQKKKLERLPKALAEWLDAAKRFPSLDDIHLQMARELQLSPAQLESIGRHPEQRGGVPLDQYLERRYLNEFGRERPTSVLPLAAQLLHDWKTNLAKRRNRRSRLQRKLQSIN